MRFPKFKVGDKVRFTDNALDRMAYPSRYRNTFEVDAILLYQHDKDSPYSGQKVFLKGHAFFFWSTNFERSNGSKPS